MSLPSGYKLLEYIQSTGTQYIDTGFQISPQNYNKVKIVADTIIGTAPNGWAVTGTGNGVSVYYGCGNNSRQIWYGSGTSDVNSGYTYDNARRTFTLDMENRKFSVSGILDISINIGQPSGSNGFYLFAYREYGTNNAVCHTETVYSFQIYDNGTLVRDFIPCKNASNAVGLWDNVNSQFYGNAGTGTFTAGAEVQHAPPKPSNLHGDYDGELINLSWEASSGAIGYKVYRDGLEIADINAVSYSDAVTVFAIYVYGVSAYNADGESEQSQIAVPASPDNPIPYLITDRTQADVNRVKALSAKGFSGMTAAEQEEFLADLKGAYNASDLNRVGAAVRFVADRLAENGYACDVLARQNWMRSDIPTQSEMGAYVADVETIRSALAVKPNTPATPEDAENLTYIEANGIEQILLDVDSLITKMMLSFVYCGQPYAGQIWEEFDNAG